MSVVLQNDDYKGNYQMLYNKDLQQLLKEIFLLHEVLGCRDDPPLSMGSGDREVHLSCLPISMPWCLEYE
jgi:hypothetical protein